MRGEGGGREVVGCVPAVSVCGGNFKLAKKFSARIRRVAAVAMLHTFWRLAARLPKSPEMASTEGRGRARGEADAAGLAGCLLFFAGGARLMNYLNFMRQITCKI